MQGRMRRWIVFCLSIFTLNPISAQDPVLFRISVENNPSHIQAKWVGEFARRLAERMGERFSVRFHHSGSLYRDMDVFAALANGELEMAVPGTWTVSTWQPDLAIFLLPAFFGASAQQMHDYSDGRLGIELSRRVEEQLQVLVPGPWMDLGPAHLYFLDRRVRKHSALRGKVIRVAGGAGNELRLAALGATPVIVPWTEVAQRLRSGQIDGLLSTHETVRSGELWKAGIRLALEDFQYFPQYVPIISRSLWNRLSPEEQAVIREEWTAVVQQERIEAATAQVEARAELQKNGIKIRTVPEQDRIKIRLALLAEQERIAARLGVDTKLLELIHAQP